MRDGPAVTPTACSGEQDRITRAVKSHTGQVRQPKSYGFRELPLATNADQLFSHQDISRAGQEAVGSGYVSGRGRLTGVVITPTHVERLLVEQSYSSIGPR